MVFITLTSLFVIIVICCLIEVYRSHLAYKRRIERETDEDIIWSKEQATKMHESPGVGGQPYVYKAVSIVRACASTYMCMCVCVCELMGHVVPTCVRLTQEHAGHVCLKYFSFVEIHFR